VKIDRSFLEGIDSDRPLTLLRGVARLSADLGMLVVVEGIETNEQLELISADGTVTEAQGYLFSRPVPAVRVRQLLNASHSRRFAGRSNYSRCHQGRSPDKSAVGRGIFFPGPAFGAVFNGHPINPNAAISLHKC